MARVLRTLFFTTLIISAANVVFAQSDAPFQDQMLRSLYNKQVQNELELVGEQKDELDEILKEIGEKWGQLHKDLGEIKKSGASKSEIDAESKALWQAFGNEKSRTDKDIMNVLLPHQQQRLRETTIQLTLRNRLRWNRELTGPLIPEIRDYLGIDKAQEKNLRELATRKKKELDAKIKKLYEEFHESLLKELSSEQRKKYGELLGDKVKTFDNPKEKKTSR